MEVKLIIYIVGGILYFLYKRAQEAKKETPPATETNEQAPAEPKPIRPPAYNPMDELRRELQRKQAAAEAQKRLSAPQPLQTAQRVSQPKEILIHEKKTATFGEGANDAPVYERELLEPEKTVRGNIKLKNEGVYKIETMEEARASADDTGVTEYEFDAKQAFIGSVIFERKY